MFGIDFIGVKFLNFKCLQIPSITLMLLLSIWILETKIGSSVGIFYLGRSREIQDIETQNFSYRTNVDLGIAVWWFFFSCFVFFFLGEGGRKAATQAIKLDWKAKLDNLMMFILFVQTWSSRSALWISYCQCTSIVQFMSLLDYKDIVQSLSKYLILNGSMFSWFVPLGLFSRNS